MSSGRSAPGRHPLPPLALQVRQHVYHKRTFLFLEQLILKHGADVNCTKIKDIHEWLLQIGVRKPSTAPFESPVTVTYHDSCHLVHGQKVSKQPRDLLKNIPGVELLELPEASWCCGSAGIYNITQPEQSAELLARKVKHIEKTGAHFLAQSNPGCHLQIARGLKEAGSTIRVTQPVELLALAYRREPQPVENKK